MCSINTCILTDRYRIFPDILFLFEIQFAGDPLVQYLNMGKTLKFRESSTKASVLLEDWALALSLPDFLQP